MFAELPGLSMKLPHSKKLGVVFCSVCDYLVDYFLVGGGRFLRSFGLQRTVFLRYYNYLITANATAVVSRNLLHIRIGDSIKRVCQFINVTPNNRKPSIGESHIYK